MGFSPSLCNCVQELVSSWCFTPSQQVPSPQGKCARDFSFFVYFVPIVVVFVCLFACLLYHYSVYAPSIH